MKANFLRAISVWLAILISPSHLFAQEQGIPVEERARLFRELLRCGERIDKAYSKGDYAAVEMEERTQLRINEHVLGPDFPTSVAIRECLAWTLKKNGKLDDAIKEFQTVISARERLQGPEHAETIAARTTLGATMRLNGSLAAAEDEHRALLTICQRVFGADSPRAIYPRKELALDLKARQKYAEFETEERAILASQERALGARDRDTISTRLGLAVVLANANKGAESQEQWDLAMAGAERPLNHGAFRLHMSPERTLTLERKGMPAEAIDELRNDIGVLMPAFGSEDSLVLFDCYHLALCLHKKGKHTEASTLVKQAEQGWSKKLGPDDEDCRNARELRRRIETTLKK